MFDTTNAARASEIAGANLARLSRIAGHAVEAHKDLMASTLTLTKVETPKGVTAAEFVKDTSRISAEFSERVQTIAGKTVKDSFNVSTEIRDAIFLGFADLREYGYSCMLDQIEAVKRGAGKSVETLAEATRKAGETLDALGKAVPSPKKNRYQPV